MLRAATRLSLALLLLAALPARAEKPIQDNSFLVEEAYNQEPGVIQHISFFSRDRASGDWLYSFTEEWPARGQVHQASVTVPVQRLTGPSGHHEVGLGDVAVNYRWQAVGDGDAPVAVAPRLSALLPTGDSGRGLGSGRPGAQVNLPVSAALGKRFVGHFNLGATWTPSARTPAGRGDLTAVSLAQGLVWLAHPHVNVMLEAAYSAAETATGTGTVHAQTFLLSPGLRGAVDLPLGVQLVAGAAHAFGVGPSAGSRAILAYLSFEHAVTKHPW